MKQDLFISWSYNYKYVLLTLTCKCALSFCMGKVISDIEVLSDPVTYINPHHASVEYQTTQNHFTIFSQIWNLRIFIAIWIQFKKCFQMSVSKPIWSGGSWGSS